MARALIAGAPPLAVRAHRQVIDRETGKWRTAKKHEGRASTDRFRAQASVRLFSGEVVKADATAKTASAAEARLKAKLNALLAASDPKQPAPTMTVGEVTRSWLDDPRRHAQADTTRALYAHVAERWLLGELTPDLAKLPMQDVDSEDVTTWLLAIAEHSGVPTAKTARSVLSSVFKYALSRRLATFNVTRDASPPDERVVAEVRARRAAQTPVEVVRAKKRGPGAALDPQRGFTAAEQDRVIATVRATAWAIEEDLPDLLAYLVGTGVRLGEALVVVWDDLDLDHTGWAADARLSDEHAWVRTGTYTASRVPGAGVQRKEHGATKRGERALALPTWLADILRERLATRTSDIVFGNPLAPDAFRDASRVTKLVRRLLDSIDGDDGKPLTWASSHTFRRTMVTTFHRALVPDRTIADQTGHDQVQVLQEHYFARLRLSTLAAELVTVPGTASA